MATGEITVKLTGLDEYIKWLKYAEEAGAVCEEMKLDIEKSILEIDKEVSKQNNAAGAGLCRAKDIVKNNLSKYLDK